MNLSSKIVDKRLAESESSDTFEEFWKAQDIQHAIENST
jgi:hypothetical protein